MKFSHIHLCFSILVCLEFSCALILIHKYVENGLSKEIKLESVEMSYCRELYKSMHKNQTKDYLFGELTNAPGTIIILCIAFTLKVSYISKYTCFSLFSDELFYYDYEECFYPQLNATIRGGVSGTAAIEYDRRYAGRRVSYIKIVTGQIPEINQNFTVTEGEFNTPLFNALFSFDETIKMYFHITIYDRKDFVPMSGVP